MQKPFSQNNSPDTRQNYLVSNLMTPLTEEEKKVVKLGDSKFKNVSKLNNMYFNSRAKDLIY
jgi:hypothetical protein